MSTESLPQILPDNTVATGVGTVHASLRPTIRRPLRRIRPIVLSRLSPWHVFAAAVMAILAIWVCSEPWTEIMRLASSNEEYSHIFLVPFVAAFLIWSRRLRLRHFAVTGNLLGPLILALGWGMTSYGFNNAVEVLWQAGPVVVLIGAITSVLGKNAIFRFLPVVFVLFFMVPVPGEIRQNIALPLQHWTAQIAQVLLELIGVHAEVVGNTLRVNGEVCTIAEACNGMRLVFPLLLITFAFAYGLPLRNSVRAVLIASSPLVALVCNVVRTVPTIWLYGYHSQSTADQFHSLSGWAMLPLAFLALLAIVRALKWAMLPVERYTLAAQ